MWSLGVFFGTLVIYGDGASATEDDFELQSCGITQAALVFSTDLIELE